MNATGSASLMDQHRHEVVSDHGLASAILPWLERPERTQELRQFLRGFTHKCRNSLQGIKMGLYLFRRGMDGPMPDAWVGIERAYRETERLFDRLQEVYRPMHTTLVRSSLAQLFDGRLAAWRESFAERGLTFQADRPTVDAVGDYDPMHLGSGLDAFIAWRLQDVSSCGSARLTWRVRQGCFEIEWTEAGAAPLGPVDARSSRASAGFGGCGSGDSLALPLLARIASAHGGRLLFSTDPFWHLIIRWPQSQADPLEQASHLDGGGEARLTSNCGTERGA
jgi:hypothetical protein